MGKSRGKHAPLDFVLLSGFGTLCVHELAYAPASLSRAAVAHAHLPLLWALASPLALVALGLYVVRSLNSRPGNNRVDAFQLGLGISVAFGLLEIGERALNGLSVQGLLFEQVFWLGIGLIPIVATLLACLVTTTVSAIRCWVDLTTGPEFVLVPVLHSATIGETTLTSQHLRSARSQRGPPNRIVH
jgi:hypothetical protein